MGHPYRPDEEMALPESACVPIASTIKATFSHAEQFDFIDLRLEFGGAVFGSSPLRSDWYDGPWEDTPCEQAEFVVYFSSVFCAFKEFVKFLEALAVGVEQCSFNWDAEGPHGCLAWQRVSQDGIGFLSVTWHSRRSFRYVARIDAKCAGRVLYGAFREFVESESYDPVRYERMTIGESISHCLEEDEFERFPGALTKLDAMSAEALLRITSGGPDERPIRGPKRRYSISNCLECIDEDVARIKKLGPAVSLQTWIPSEWDHWPLERRLEETDRIMGWEGIAWYGNKLREIRSFLLENWLEKEAASS